MSDNAEWFNASSKLPQHNGKPQRRVEKIGGSFQHTGIVVAEFKTTTGEDRIVIEFDAPVQGMLHVYRPDQVRNIL